MKIITTVSLLEAKKECTATSGRSGISQTGAPNPNGRVHVLFGQILPKIASKNEENWTQTQGVSKILLCRSATGH